MNIEEIKAKYCTDSSAFADALTKQFFALAEKAQKSYEESFKETKIPYKAEVDPAIKSKMQSIYDRAMDELKALESAVIKMRDFTVEANKGTVRAGVVY